MRTARAACEASPCSIGTDVARAAERSTAIPQRYEASFTPCLLAAVSAVMNSKTHARRSRQGQMKTKRFSKEPKTIRAPRWIRKIVPNTDIDPPYPLGAPEHLRKFPLHQRKTNRSLDGGSLVVSIAVEDCVI